MDQFARLRTFIAVAERASFAAAARALRMSPSAATRAVASLERDLGVALLRRTTRSVRLTDAGAAYLERSRHALAELADAAREAAGEDAAPHGLLVVTAPLVFGRLRVLPVVSGLLAAHPALDVRLVLSDRAVRLVDEGVDVAVRIGALADSALRAVRVGAVRRVLVASPAYLDARGTPDTPAALAAHHLLAFEALTPAGEWRFGTPPGRPVRVSPRLRTDSVEAAIDAALLDSGIARVFDYQVAAHLAAGRLRTVLDDAAPPPEPVHLLTAEGRYPSPNVRAFVAAARAALG